MANGTITLTVVDSVLRVSCDIGGFGIAEKAAIIAGIMDTLELDIIDVIALHASTQAQEVHDCETCPVKDRCIGGGKDDGCKN